MDSSGENQKQQSGRIGFRKCSSRMDPRAFVGLAWASSRPAPSRADQRLEL